MKTRNEDHLDSKLKTHYIRIQFVEFFSGSCSFRLRSKMK